MIRQSETFLNLITTLHKLRKQAIVSPAYTNSFNSNGFERVNTNTLSHRVPQPIVISDANLYEKCTSGEWHLIGRISIELKEYNCLWQCDAQAKLKNTNYRKSIAGLVEKDILIKTETTNIYVVNPLYIRKGDLFAVLATTANMLEDQPRVTTDHIKNKRSVKTYEIIQPQLGYGYHDGTEN